MVERVHGRRDAGDRVRGGRARRRPSGRHQPVHHQHRSVSQSVSRRPALRPVRLSHARGSKTMNFRAVLTMEE